jgi:hypothetical protein
MQINGGKKRKDIMAKDTALLKENGTMMGWIRDLFSTGPQS